MGTPQLKPCPTCGKPVANTARKCPHCGGVMPQSAVEQIVVVAVILVVGFMLLAWGVSGFWARVGTFITDVFKVFVSK